MGIFWIEVANGMVRACLLGLVSKRKYRPHNLESRFNE